MTKICSSLTISPGNSPSTISKKAWSNLIQSIIRIYQVWQIGKVIWDNTKHGHLLLKSKPKMVLRLPCKWCWRDYRWRDQLSNFDDAWLMPTLDPRAFWLIWPRQPIPVWGRIGLFLPSTRTSFPPPMGFPPHTRPPYSGEPPEEASSPFSTQGLRHPLWTPRSVVLLFRFFNRSLSL